MRITVIVPVRDDPQIDGLLSSLAAQRGVSEFEVLIAMDGSRREPRVPPALPVRLLRLPARGQFHARNSAIREATGDLLLFTDSDCLCPPDWVTTAARLFEKETVAALQGASRASDNSRLSRFIQLEYERYVASHASDGYRHFCNTRNFAIRASLARQLPMPEALARGGDGVYGRMLEANGIAIRYEPEWRVGHRHPTSRWEEGLRAFAQGHYGALWKDHIGLDLFTSDNGGAQKGAGAWLLAFTRDRPMAVRAASLALLPVAAVNAVLSAVLPGDAGANAFSRFRRAAHLAGRFSAEAKAKPS